MTLQRLHIGGDTWESEADPATPAVLAGPHLYAIGTIGGGIRAFGEGHLIGQMGGVWAHPLRALHGWSFGVGDAADTALLQAADTCDLYGSHLVRRYTVGALEIAWTEVVAEDAPALVGMIEIQNRAPAVWRGVLRIEVEPDIRGGWFSGWELGPPDILVVGSRLIYKAAVEDMAWEIALAVSEAELKWQQAGKAMVANRPLELGAGMSYGLTIALAVQRSEQSQPALDQAERIVARGAAVCGEKLQSYDQARTVKLDSTDHTLKRAWDLALLNLQLLRADYRPAAPAYFLAGLPEYPQLFGCDTTYTVPGATAGGFAGVVREALLALAGYASNACGRFPHEITTNGRVFHPGNIQETPQFVQACWEYLCWSGDLDFARRVYPICREAMLDLLPTQCAFDGLYPIGNGMVERLGMGECKLDSACYHHAGLIALAQLSEALNMPDAAQCRARAAVLLAAFERDWWSEDEQCYADSLHLDGRKQFDGHWTAVVPVQLGVATPERANRVLDWLERECVNRWGLVHTRGKVESVWTLPTGLLALAEFAHGRAELGMRLLRNIAVTTEHGALGLFKELIPEGMCFIQLWSAGLFLQGVTQGLLGIQPRAHEHALALRPCMASGMEPVRLNGLGIGAHSIDLVVGPRSVHLTHQSGPAPLMLLYAERSYEIMPGESVDSAM